jgi:hypothetical protein
MYGWNERPTKAEIKHFIGGDSPAAVLKIGEYLVTFPWKEGNDALAVTYRSEHRHSTNPRETLPNMEVCDGQIRIELTDLVGLVLSRLEPADLAQTLWQDEEVRREFMGCLIRRYNEQGIGDKERREFLAGVKETIHDESVDRAAAALASGEYNFAKEFYTHDTIDRVNRFLRDREVRREDGEVVQFKSESQVDQFKIGGAAWNEARDYWREKIAERFPAPVAVESETAEDLK